MFKYTIALFLILTVYRVDACDCGCGSPSPICHFSDLGTKLCDPDFDGPLQMHKPMYPPPPCLCKELGIEHQQPYYPAPPSCGCGGSWQPIVPKCLRKKLRYPFCMSSHNLHHQKLAMSKLRVYGNGCNYNPKPPCSVPSCGCGCH